MNTSEGFWETATADLVANKLMSSTLSWSYFSCVRKIVWAFLFHPRYTCVFFYRLNRYLYERKLPGKDILSARRIYLFGNDISYYARIGPGLRLVHLSDIVIGGKVVIGRQVTILNGVTLGSKRREETDMPRIGNNVYIGSGSKLLGGIVIGDNVTIGAMTFYDKDIPARCVVYGIPPSVTVQSIESQR